MAADQRKKKRVAASLAGCTSHEKYRVNVKKLHVRKDLNTRPNISLEWDSRKKSVVSRKEQIGFSKRHLIPFIEPGSRGHNFLADVLPVPAEIFELDSLSEVLSYEVWQSYLSDNERSFLSQFLPKGVEPDKTVQDLLSGDNLHFGNPSMKCWSEEVQVMVLVWKFPSCNHRSDSLCRGELHPDNVLHEEQSLKAAKKGYYSFLENYHSDMVENLQMWKEKWSSCMDAEVDTMQNIWSSRKHGEKPMRASDVRFCGTEENPVATPDSCSWANSELAYSSENQNLGTVQGESRRRKEFLKKMSDTSSSGLKVVAAAHRKGEKLNQWNIQQNDGAKYMSYIKVSKEQHERVKSSIKYAGNSIQPRSLNNVLGSFDALNVQPFARFEEEECKKLHEYWVKLATKDILVGFTNWRNRQLQRQELRQFLGEEIGQKVELQENTLVEEKDASSNSRMELSDGEELPPSDTVEGVEKEQSDDVLLEQNSSEESIHEMASEIEDQKKIGNDYIFEKRASNCREMSEDEDAPNNVFVQDHSEPQVSSLNNSPRSTKITSSSPGFHQDQHQQQISSLDSNPHTNSTEMESHGDSGSAKDEDPPIVSGYSGNMNHVDVPLSQGATLPSSSDVWAVNDVHGSFYHSTTSNSGYASNHEMSVGHPQLMQAEMLNLQSHRSEEDSRNRQTEDLSFFSSFSNPDRSELLHSLVKGQSNLSYHELPKLAALDYQARNDLVMETGQFPGHLREQVHPLSIAPPIDLRQKRLNDLYVHQNIQESIIYPGSQFREDFQVNVHDWTTSVNSVRLPVPCQPHLNSGELGPPQAWYAATAAENGNRDGWPSLEPSVGLSHGGFNSGSSNSDQTLFSVLSECHELPRAVNFDAAIQAGNYHGGMIGGIPSSSSTNFVAQPPTNPLHYLSGHEAASGGIKMNNMGWIGLPQQNSRIQESIGKPFLRSWHQ